MSNYQGAWKQQKDRLANVNLPTQVKCSFCKKNLLHARFSKNELDKYRGFIRDEGHNAKKLPLCLNCKGGPKDEFECYMCNKVKSRDKFTKVQLRNPDHAKCNDCQQDISDQEANLEDALEEERIKDEIETQRSASGSAGPSILSYSSSVQASLRGASTKVRSAGIETASDGLYVPEQEFETFSLADSSGYPSFNPHGVHSRQGSASVISTTTSHSNNSSGYAQSWAQQFPPSLGARARPSASEEGSSRRAGEQFVKIGAPKESAHTRAVNRIARADQRANQEEEGPVVDEDDDDDDDELPY